MKSNKVFLIAVGIIAAVAIGFFTYSKKSEKQHQPAQAKYAVTSVTELVKDHSPVFGPKDAKITLVEFLDPECEACRSMYPIVKQLMDEYKGQIRLVIRYMPFHGNSYYAASVLEEARELGKYEEALFTLFRTQPEWGSHHDPKPELIVKYMEEIGIKPSQIEKDKIMAKHKETIDMDFADGKSLGVRLTPTFFVNGKMLHEIGYEPVKAAIDEALSN